MIRRSAVPLALVLAALGLALVARGAFAVDRELRTGTPEPGVATGLASSLAGAQPHRELRQALAVLRQGGGTIAAELARLRRAAILLAAPAAHGDAQAANLLGVISGTEAAIVRSDAADSLAAARAEFVEAIHDDPAGEDAKHNLELLLALEAKQQRRQQKNQGGGERRPGTGHAPPGSGY